MEIKYKATWLPKYNIVPESAYGFPTCMYLVSLEGWRRGLDLKFYLKRSKSFFSGVSYSLSDGITERFFNGARGDSTSKKAISICANKGWTNELLASGNVPVPVGRAFSEDASIDDILEYANEIGYPLVLKPIIGGGGAGVVTNIKNKKEMGKHLKDFRKKSPRKTMVVERHFVGEDFRVTVFNGEVIGAFHRRAQSVLGDGENTLEGLLHLKNEDRKLSPFLNNKVIEIDKKMEDYLREQNKTPKYIPEKGERVYLRKNGEFFGQRDSVNATDTISPEMKKIAVAAVKAIPGLNFAGVDMLIDLDKNEGVVNEVNSKPQISNHVFPIEGESVDIPKLIIDHYFPETKGETDTNYFYEYKPVLQNFKNGTATEVKIPPLPTGDLIAKKYVVTGENFNDKFFTRIQKQAIDLSLNGLVSEISSNYLSVVVSGNAKDLARFKQIIKKHPYKYIKVVDILEKDYREPIKVGFEIKQDS
ncbi:acylphosphatase [Virgibacillus kimchii]